jgi:gamma-glutamyltranspeptidase/glutathione hydrolase
MYTLPAPASGAIWLSAMGMLPQFEPAGQGTVLDSHRVTEALRVSLFLLSVCTRLFHLADK